MGHWATVQDPITREGGEGEKEKEEEKKKGEPGRHLKLFTNFFLFSPRSERVFFSEISERFPPVGT